MPSFKPKTNKEITTDIQRNITLDIKHNEDIKKFHTYETIKIPELKDKIETIKKEQQMYAVNHESYKKCNKLIAKYPNVVEVLNKVSDLLARPAIIAPTIITDEIAFVTDIKGV